MKPELKVKWLAALRSGEYRQEKNVLHNPETGGYCCYGVLRPVVTPLDERSAGKGTVLSREQLVEYGFDAAFNRSMLECMNDGVDPDNENGITRQHTFAEIADYIEANL